MKRPVSLLRVAGALAATALLAIGVSVHANDRPSGRFELVEATIGSIQQAIDDRVITPDDLVRMYFARIAAYDGKQTATHLNSYIAINADALRQAKGNNGNGRGHRKGVLFGIPIILKDN